MRAIDKLLNEYGESHQHSTNKTIHWICIPIIMFSLVGLLWSIPVPRDIANGWINVGSVLIMLAMIYYIRLSINLFIGFLFIGSFLIVGNYFLFHSLKENSLHLFLFSFTLFFFAWVGQFYGHKVEGKKPSFFKDLQFLLIGPAWLLHFIYKRIGITY